MAEINPYKSPEAELEAKDAKPERRYSILAQVSVVFGTLAVAIVSFTMSMICVMGLVFSLQELTDASDGSPSTIVSCAILLSMLFATWVGMQFDQYATKKLADASDESVPSS